MIVPTPAADANLLIVLLGCLATALASTVIVVNMRRGKFFTPFTFYSALFMRVPPGPYQSRDDRDQGSLFAFCSFLGARARAPAHPGRAEHDEGMRLPILEKSSAILSRIQC